MRVLCLNIDEQQFHLVEAERRGSAVTVLRASSHRSQQKWGTALLHGLPFDYAQAREFIRECAALLYAEPVFTSRLLLTLPHTVPTVFTLPVDSTCTAFPPEDQARWAGSFLFPSVGNGPLALLSQPLTGRNDQALLAVALPESTIRFLHDAFRHLEFHIEGLEADHFIMQRLALDIMRDLHVGSTAILGLFPSSSALSILHHGHLHSFSQRAITYRTSYLVQVLEFLRDGLDQAQLSLHGVAVHGAGARPDLVEALASHTGIPVRRISPLSSVSPLGPAIGSRLRKPEGPFDSALGHILDYYRCESPEA